jgi:serine/threonine protein kinase/WD40 repeat protein
MSATPNRVQAVFLAAVEIENTSDRRALLDRECAGDPELRDRIEALLRAHEQPQSLLDSPTPAADDSPTGPFDPVAGSRPPGEVAGAVIANRYKLVEPIGEGGMGSVWVAEQTAPIRRLVALKLVKPGMDSTSVLTRFEAERQALALMDHPHIAKILDAGTTESGRPFFVMELVKGLPLTEYCDARRLPISNRLELFQQICAAVQHAHQKGIIHRDLKPTNILVTEHDGRPNPKVIDFGLAKALHSPHLLTERTLFTAFGAVVGTPLYMAPEQVATNALDVDTRADIYALGVILYELLTGTTPLEKRRVKAAAWDEFMRLIRDEEPPKPSTRLSSADALPSIAALRHTEPAKLGKLIRGDLDWIVMKSLEKDRNRRYETADALALDVARYLQDEPVLAGPPSAAYWLRKFVKRNRTRVISAMVFVVVLIVGAVGSTLFAIQASRNEAEAVKARGDAVTQAGLATQNAAEAKAEAERVRGMLHAANMGRAQDALRGGRIARTRQLLEEMRPEFGKTDLRGFEWHYLWNLLHAGRDVANIHSAGGGTLNWNTDCPALSSDGRWAASARMAPLDYKQPADGKPPPLMRGTFNYWIRVWDTATGQIVFARDASHPNKGGQGIGHDVAICPSAGLAAWGLDRSITVYDVAANTERKVITLDHPLGFRQRHEDGPVAPVLLFDPTGAQIAALTLVETKAPGSGRTMRTFQLEVREVASGRRLLEVPPTDSWVPRAVGFSADGTQLAVRYGRNGPFTPGKANPQLMQSRIAVWNIGDDKPRFELPASDDQLVTYPFTADGRWLALIRGRAVALYDAATGQPGRVYDRSEQPVRTFAFARDGLALAVGDATGTITIFADRGDVLDVLYGHETEVSSLALRPDGRLVSYARDGLVKEWAPGRSRTAISAGPPTFFSGWDMNRHALTVRHNSWVRHPGGKLVEPEYAVWDTATGMAVLRRPLALPGINSMEASPSATSLSPDGRRVVVSLAAGRDQGTLVERYGVFALIPPVPPEGLAGVARLAWSVVGRTTFVARTEIVDVATGRERLVLPIDLGTARWSLKARYVSLHVRNPSLPPGQVQLGEESIWDMKADPPQRRQLETPRPAPLASWRSGLVWFSSDERFFTVLGAIPRDVKMPFGPADHYLSRWEVATGRLVFSQPFPDPLVSREDKFVVSPAGDRLARLTGVEIAHGMPGSRPPALELWDIQPDGAISRLWTVDTRWAQERDDLPTYFAYPFIAVDFSPDGRRLFVIGENETRAWDLAMGGAPIVYKGKRGVPAAVAHSPDDRRLVMVTAPEREDAARPAMAELRVWDLTTGQELLSMPIPVRMPHSGTSGWAHFDGQQLRLLGGGREELSAYLLDGKPR